MRRLLCLLALASVLLAPPALATELRPIVLDPSYQHDRFVTEPQDHVRQFRAYTVSFDGDDDNDGDGEGDVWGIPEWVAYEIKRHPGPVPSAFEDRPRPWMDDDELVEVGACPTTTATGTAATPAATCACGRSPVGSAATPTGTATRS